MSVVVAIAAFLLSGASGASPTTLAVGIMVLALLEYFKPALAALSRVIANELERGKELEHVKLQNRISAAVAAAMAAAAVPVPPVPVQAIPVPAVPDPVLPRQIGVL